MKKMTRVQRKKRRRRNFFRIILLTIFLIFILKVARESNYFNIKTINIEGNINVKNKEILKKSKLKINDNIFDISTVKVNKNIKNIVYIKDSKTRRKFPNEIKISVEERKESIQFNNKNKYIVVDNEGIILDLMDKVKKDLLIVKGVEFKEDIKKENRGKKIAESIKIKEDKEFLKNCIENNITTNVRLIDIVDSKNILMKTKDNNYIEFGDLTNSDYKLKMLNEILNYIKEEEIVYSKIIMDKGNNPIIVTKKVGD